MRHGWLWVTVVASTFGPACSKPNPLYGYESAGGGDSESPAGSDSASAGSSTASSTTNTSVTSASMSDSTTADSTDSTTETGGTTGTNGEDYGYRRQLTVTADPSAAVPSGSTLSFQFDTQAEIDAGRLRADQRDFRILRCGDDGCDERNRWIDEWKGQGWNTPETWTWFRFEPDLNPGGTDDRYYIYYGYEDPPDEPLSSMDGVFLFGDDFESDLSKWSPNQENETYGLESTQVAVGQQSLRVEPGDQSNGGVHHDVQLPDVPLMFSLLFFAEPMSGSFALVRAGTTAFDERVPNWNEASLRVHCEIDVQRRMHFVEQNPFEVRAWGPTPLAQAWYHLEVVLNPATDQVDGILNKTILSGTFAAYNAHETPIRHVTLEGEGQGGTFYVDDYFIRRYLASEPTVTVGPLEML